MICSTRGSKSSGTYVVNFCLSVEFFLAALLAAHLKLLHAASPSVLSGCGGESHCDAIVYPSQSDSHGCTRPKRFFILNITLRKQTTFVHISTIKLIKIGKNSSHSPPILSLLSSTCFRYHTHNSHHIPSARYSFLDRRGAKGCVPVGS